MYLNGNDLYQMFKYGATFISRKRKILNDINVFPVPDGDTGNNLAMTLQTIMTESVSKPSFHVTLDSISNAALIGARGNSGIIFAQFINGLRLSSAGDDEVSLERFAMMANDSVEHTYHSLSQPVEGTILTVMKSWANNLLEYYKQATSNRDFFLHAYAKAKIALDETKEQLEVLKKRDVIDSGALGFVTFLEGINSYFNAEQLEQESFEEIIIEHDHSEDDIGLYRYCTEGLVSHNNQKEDEILKALQGYGDSLIVAVGATMFRVHIHTNEPSNVFQVLSGFGHIIAQKVDDMTLDIKMKQTKYDTVIVTDSICDIDQNYLLINDVSVLPINVMIENVNYLDKLTINNTILFGLIDKGIEYPTTATPSSKNVKDLFDKLFGVYQKIVVISVSSKLSATYEVIQAEVKNLQSLGKEIVHIDSLTNSAAEGLLVKHAVELVQQQKSLTEIKEIINDEKARSEILVCLETFKYATMSGRLPKAVGNIGMALGIRPIMAIDKQGKGTAFGFALSQKGITKKIVKHIKRDLQEQGIEKYALVHCENIPLVKTYETLFTDIIGKKPEYIAEVSSATAIHSGKGSVAIAYIKERKL